MTLAPSADDRFAIADLCARYAWALDVGDTEGVVACFTEDAIFDEIVYARGRDQIRKAVKQLFHDNPLFAGRQHAIGQTLFSPDDEGRPDHWRMKSFAHVFVLRDTGASL
ncbi:MAG: nuclear transport factor 2 family protein, partial [Microbacterium sp.]